MEKRKSPKRPFAFLLWKENPGLGLRFRVATSVVRAMFGSSTKIFAVEVVKVSGLSKQQRAKATSICSWALRQKKKNHWSIVKN
ncbi:hypothetical protein MOD92_00895 [Bacillus spizizenii]|nr:hypothetical protein [Bacillus spizizenii]